MSGHPLWMLRRGQSGIITEIRGAEKFQHRLAELGFTEGVEVLLLNSTGRTFSVRIRDTRLAIGFEAAMNIMVSKVEGRVRRRTRRRLKDG